MKRYLNIKYSTGVETLDELNSEDFKTYADFKAEMRRLSSEYSMAGMGGCYWSKRSTKGWN